MTHADPLDEATEREQQQIQISLANRQPPLPFTGKCRSCGESIDKGHCCDIYCREDAMKHERAAKFKRH